MVRARAMKEGMLPSDVASHEYTVVEWVDEKLLRQSMIDAAVRGRKWRRRPGGAQAFMQSLSRKAARRWRAEPRGFLLKYVYDVERYKETHAFVDEKHGLELAFVGSPEAKAAGVAQELADYPGADSDTLVVVTRLVRLGEDMNENERAQAREQDLILEGERRGVQPGWAIVLLGERDVRKWHLNRVKKELWKLCNTKRKDAVVTFLKPHVKEENKVDLFMKTERRLNWKSMARFEDEYEKASILSPVEVAKHEHAKLLVQYFLHDELELYARRLRQRQDLERFISMVTVWGVDLEAWFRVSRAEVRARRAARMQELRETAEEAKDARKRREKKAMKRAREGMVAADAEAEEARVRLRADAREARVRRVEHQREVAAARVQRRAEDAARDHRLGLDQKVHAVNAVHDGVTHTGVVIAALRRRGEWRSYPPPPEVPEGGFALEPGQAPTPAERWVEVPTEVDGEKRSYFYDPVTFAVSWSPRVAEGASNGAD
eukprot:g5530.t1